MRKCPAHVMNHQGDMECYGCGLHYSPQEERPPCARRTRSLAVGNRALADIRKILGQPIRPRN